MQDTDQKQSYLLSAPIGLRWLLKLSFAHGFWGGFLTFFLMTPLLMILISAIWTHTIPTWAEQFKSFIIGDTLLAITAGLLAVLTGLDAGAKSYEIGKLYWIKCLGVGTVGSILFIANEMRKEMLTFEQLFQPHLVYHHVFLFIVLIAMLSGMTFIQYQRSPRSKTWIAIGLLLLGYVLLVIYDTVYPPLGIK